MKKLWIPVLVSTLPLMLSCNRDDPTSADLNGLTPSFSISGTYTLAGGPYASVVTASNTAWIGQSTNGTVTKMDINAGTFSSSVCVWSTCSPVTVLPFALDKNSDGSLIYVGAFDESGTNRGVVASISTGGTPAVVDRFSVPAGDVSGIIATTGNIVYAGMTDGPIHKIQLAGGSGSIVTTRTLPTAYAYHFAWDQNKTYLYASSYGTGVYKLDPTSLDTLAHYTGTTQTQGLAFSADWTKLYVASQTGSITVLYAATLQPVSTVATGECHAIGLLLANYLLYDACTTDGLFHGYDPLSKMSIEADNVTGKPREMSYDPGTQKIVVPNENGWVNVITPPAYTVKFAAPTGAGSGTIEQPWGLNTAIDNATAGTTVYLRGGTYPGIDKDITHSGTSPSVRITFRQYPDERVTIDGRLRVHAQHITLWGLEVMDSHLGDHTDAILGTNNGWKGIEVGGASDDVALTEMVVHDVASSGVIYYWPAGTVTMKGSILYNNGTSSQDHGVYIQNRADVSHTGTAWFVENVVFDNFAYGVHAFSDGTPESTYPLASIYVLNNILFDNGGIAPTVNGQTGEMSNILMGSALNGSTALNATGNLSYWSRLPSSSTGNQIGIQMGWTGIGQSMSVQGNTILGGKKGLMTHRWSNATVEANDIGGPTTSVPPIEVEMLETGPLTNYIWNTNWYETDGTRLGWVYPAGVTKSLAQFLSATTFPHPAMESPDRASGIPFPATTRVLTDAAVPKKAFVSVYNPSSLPSVTVFLGGFLTSCYTYQVYNVQDLYTPIFGTPKPCTETSADLPMSSTLTPPAPITAAGRNVVTGPTTGPYFHVFVVVKQ